VQSRQNSRTARPDCIEWPEKHCALVSFIELWPPWLFSNQRQYDDTSTTKMLEWSSKSCSMYQLQGTTIVRPRHAKVYMFNPAPMQIVVEVGATHRNRTFKCSIDSPSPSVDCIVSFGEKGTPEFRFRRTSEPVTNCPFVISMQSGNVYLSRYGLV
jgi:hypothetical protein